jgi:hypothetical protein
MGREFQVRQEIGATGDNLDFGVSGMLSEERYGVVRVFGCKEFK